MAARYLIPRPRYFQSLRIAKHCPEIRRHIDLIAICSAANGVKLAVATPFALVSFLLVRIAGLLQWPFHQLPDFDEKRLSLLREAHDIVPVAEIRERIGLPPERGVILTKKDEALRTLDKRLEKPGKGGES